MTAAQLHPAADDLLPRLSRSPDAYPQKIDLASGRVLVVLFDANTYRQASFLDDRVLGPATQGAWLPLGHVAQAALARLRPLHFIFHTGHVGSTLVSRLLDATGSVLSLREPLPLRTLADAHDQLGRPDSLLSDAQFDLLLGLFLRLWSRGYDATQGVVVKATSSAGRLAAPILTASAASRAIYINVPAEPYLATLLAGENSPTDLRGHGPERIRRLQARVATPLAPLHALSIGELAALSWLAESWSQREAIARFAGRVVAIDFEAFLANVGEGMAGILGHLGLPADERYLAQAAQSPVLARYAKAPEHAYSPSLRTEVLGNSRRDNHAEIRKGLDWLERLARSDAAAAAIVSGASA
jgi:hypothetical protein